MGARVGELKPCMHGAKRTKERGQREGGNGREACLPLGAVVRAPLVLDGGVYLLCIVCVSIVLFVSWSFFFFLYVFFVASCPTCHNLVKTVVVYLFSFLIVHCESSQDILFYIYMYACVF